MKGFKLFLQDWKHIFKNKKSLIGISILLCMPLLYAGMFLAGYWNPYGRLDRLPVAVVNMDQGAVLDGEELHAGKDLTDELKKDHSLDFRFVSDQKGEKGLKDGDYYMKVVIPKDFSKKVTTLLEKNPEPAHLIYKTNQGNNFIAGQIGSTAVSKLRDSVGDEITKSYTKSVFSSLEELSQGFAKASDGAKKLEDGAGMLNSGFGTYTDGVHSLADGTSKLAAGLNPLESGSRELVQNMQKLNGGAASLTSGLGQLKDGSSQLAAGASSVQSGLDQVSSLAKASSQDVSQSADDSKSLTEQMQQFAKDHPELADDPKMKEMLNASQSISQNLAKANAEQAAQANGIEKLKAGQQEVAGGAKTISEKLAEASAGASKISDGAGQLNAGMEKWSGGFSAFADGVQKADNGAHQLDQSSGKLADGVNKLKDGSGELAVKLTEAADKSSDIKSNDAMVNMFSRPVQLVESQMNKVPNYGTAMVPYFLTLGLFVGGLLAANVIPFDRRSKFGHSGWTHFVNKVSLYLSISILQTIIVDAVILYGFDIHVLDLPRFILLSLLTSFIFATLILMFVSLIGPLGKFAAITLLVTQLASSGGTFPIQLAPDAIREMGKFLPMTYAVQAFRSVISTGDWTRYWNDIGILVLYIASFLVIALVMILIANKKKKSSSAEQLTA
ncbi:YhgE/Pip domain-containing protein [Falsibacillus pallidus]|uniref:Putative membrane protein n=1 Tax=Falsibacillus pallidus TaxID=493781 RepID=A0A370GG97_9BACI|nr:YhgE/Pip domain-containing protein [Falsibacillus pallidus]RDI42340.1 putative membrane protein [Falsibacillus pallidus]